MPRCSLGLNVTKDLQLFVYGNEYIVDVDAEDRAGFILLFHSVNQAC